MATTKAPDVSLAGMSDATIKAKTGCTWQRWFDALEKKGARKLDHSGIAELVAEISPQLDGWWVQSVSVGYERMAGKRVKHERPDGFQVSASRTLAAPIKTMHSWFVDAKKKERWLADADFEVTTCTPGKTVRMKWGKSGERVEIYLWQKPNGKTQVVAQHSKVKTEAGSKKAQAWWKARLAKLESLLAAQ